MGSLIVKNVLLWFGMLIMEKAVLMGQVVYGNSVLSAQFCGKPNIALNSSPFF